MEEDLTRYEYGSDSRDDIPPKEFALLLPAPEEFEQYMRHDWERLRAAGIPLKCYALTVGHEEVHGDIEVIDIIWAPTVEHAIVVVEYELVLRIPLSYFDDDVKFRTRRPGRNRARAPITPPELVELLLVNFADNADVRMQEVNCPRYPPWVQPQRRER